MTALISLTLEIASVPAAYAVDMPSLGMLVRSITVTRGITLPSLPAAITSEPSGDALSAFSGPSMSMSLHNNSKKKKKQKKQKEFQ